MGFFLLSSLSPGESRVAVTFDAVQLRFRQLHHLEAAVGCSHADVLALNSIAAFYIGKWLFADYIRKKLDKSTSPRVKKWRIIDSMFVSSGIMLVALLRLMFIPFGIISYMLGVTSVAFWDYFIGTLVIIVKIMLIVLVGCTIW